MSAAAIPYQREAVDFPPNTPVLVSLKYGQGKIISTRNGERVMFTLADERVMFLDLGPAQKINELGVNVRETFFLKKQWSGKKGERVEWVCWLSPETEKARAIAEARKDGSDPDLVGKLQDSIHQAQGRFGSQPDGTFAVPRIDSARASVSAPAQAPSETRKDSTPNSNPVGHLQGWAQFLLSETTALLDVYAAAVRYSSEKHGNLVKPEDVRALMTTAFIQTRKGPMVA